MTNESHKSGLVLSGQEGLYKYEERIQHVKVGFTFESGIHDVSSHDLSRSTLQFRFFKPRTWNKTWFELFCQRSKNVPRIFDFWGSKNWDLTVKGFSVFQIGKYRFEKVICLDCRLYFNPETQNTLKDLSLLVLHLNATIVSRTSNFKNVWKTLLTTKYVIHNAKSASSKYLQNSRPAEKLILTLNICCICIFK